MLSLCILPPKFSLRETMDFFNDSNTCELVFFSYFWNHWPCFHTHSGQLPKQEIKGKHHLMLLLYMLLPDFPPGQWSPLCILLAACSSRAVLPKALGSHCFNSKAHRQPSALIRLSEPHRDYLTSFSLGGLRLSWGRNAVGIVPHVLFSY